MRKAQAAVRAASNSICVVIILSVVFPKADWTKLKASTLIKRFALAARAAVGFDRLVRFGNILEHRHSLHQAGLVSGKPLFRSWRYRSRRVIMPVVMRGSLIRLSLALFLINVTGAIVYLHAVKLSWVLPNEQAAGIHVVTGEPFVWFAAVLPFIIAFGLLDAVWGVFICVRKTWRGGYFWAATVVIWLIALVIDFAHHQ